MFAAMKHPALILGLSVAFVCLALMLAAPGAVGCPTPPQAAEPPSSVRKSGLRIEVFEVASNPFEASIDSVFLPFNSERVYSMKNISFGQRSGLVNRVPEGSELKEEQRGGTRVGILTRPQRRLLVRRLVDEFGGLLQKTEKVVSGVDDLTRLGAGNGAFIELRQQISADEFQIALTVSVKADRTDNSKVGQGAAESPEKLLFKIWDGQTVLLLSPGDGTDASGTEAEPQRKRLILITATLLDSNGDSVHRHEN